MRLVGRARIAVWTGGGLWFIEAARDRIGVPPHAHHAIQTTFLLSGEMTVRSPDGAFSDAVIAVDADAGHSLDLDGSAALLFVDPESNAGRAVKASLLRGCQIAPVTPELLGRELEELRLAWRDLPSADLEPLGRRLVEQLAGELRPAPTDPRIARLIESLANQLNGPLSLSHAARDVPLSPGRLRHLFVEQTGMPFKSYVLWRRMMKAVELVAGGASLTEAAHAAGFSDSAHFSRTCRRMFGLPASALEYA